MGLSEKIADAESSDWLREGMTDEEVIKIISEAKEEVRERIKLIDTLDKISNEIIQMSTISTNKNDIYKADVLRIIDKYKAESKGEE